MNIESGELSLIVLAIFILLFSYLEYDTRNKLKSTTNATLRRDLDTLLNFISTKPGVVSIKGNVGIGTENPKTPFHVLSSTKQGTACISTVIEGNTTDSNGLVIKLQRNNNDSSTPKPVVDGNIVAQIQFEGVNNGVAPAGPVYGGPSAIIDCRVDSPVLSTIQRPPGAITFRTSDGWGSIERMRISSNGNVGIGGREGLPPASSLEVNDSGNPAYCARISCAPVDVPYIGGAFGNNLYYDKANSKWQTKHSTINNGGSIMTGDIYGNMYFITVPTSAPTGQSRGPDISKSTTELLNTNTSMKILNNGDTIIKGNLMINNSSIPLSINSAGELLVGNRKVLLAST